MTTEEKIQQEKIKLQNEDVSSFPSLFQQARNVVKQGWLSGMGAIKGSAFLTTPETAAARLAICSGCEFFKEPRCLKCGCYMDKKAHLELAGCPENKWGNLTTVIVKKNPKNQIYQNPISNMPIDLNTFSPQDAEEIKRLATDSLNTYDGRFNFGNLHFVASKDSEGNMTIKPFIRQPKPSPSSVLSEAENLELQRLIQENKNTELKTFEFKNYRYIIGYHENGQMYVRSQPITGINIPPPPIE